MTRYVVFLRGINVGGKNKLSMASLKACLEELGHTNVATYINSGNVVLDSKRGAKAIQSELEKALPATFELDSALIKVLAIPAKTYKAMLDGKPKGFGDQPGKYHSDAIFLMDGVKVGDAMSAFSPRENVDAVWPGKGVIYHQRLSAQRTKSRLNRVMATEFYKSMTIRNWATASKLLDMLAV